MSSLLNLLSASTYAVMYNITDKMAGFSYDIKVLQAAWNIFEWLCIPQSAACIPLSTWIFTVDEPDYKMTEQIRV